MSLKKMNHHVETKSINLNLHCESLATIFFVRFLKKTHADPFVDVGLKLYSDRVKKKRAVLLCYAFSKLSHSKQSECNAGSGWCLIIFESKAETGLFSQKAKPVLGSPF